MYSVKYYSEIRDDSMKYIYLKLNSFSSFLAISCTIKFCDFYITRIAIVETRRILVEKVSLRNKWKEEKRRNEGKERM